MLKLPLHSVLGPDLRSHRKTARITQAELAAGTGLSVPTIRLLEAGGGNLDSWQKVLDHLDLELTGRNLPAGSTLGQRLARLRRHRGMVSANWPPSSKSASRPSSLWSVAGKAAGDPGTSARGPRGRDLARPPRRVARLLHRRGEFVDEPGVGDADRALGGPRKVFGRFDLDPCAPRKTRTRVKARSHFTAEDDGLTLPWHGTVFVNPPYGRTLAEWVAKARSEVEEGRARTVVALLPARPDTSYWHDHVAGQATVYFFRGRLRFGDGKQRRRSRRRWRSGERAARRWRPWMRRYPRRGALRRLNCSRSVAEVCRAPAADGPLRLLGVDYSSHKAGSSSQPAGQVSELLKIGTLWTASSIDAVTIRPDPLGP